MKLVSQALLQLALAGHLALDYGLNGEHYSGYKTTNIYTASRPVNHYHRQAYQTTHHSDDDMQKAIAASLQDEQLKSTAANTALEGDFYGIRPVIGQGKTRVLVQFNERSCPILAIVNTLIYKEELSFPSGLIKVEEDAVLSFLKRYLARNGTSFDTGVLEELTQGLFLDPAFEEVDRFGGDTGTKIPSADYFTRFGIKIYHCYYLEASNPLRAALLSYGSTYDQVSPVVASRKDYYIRNNFKNGVLDLEGYNIDMSRSQAVEDFILSTADTQCTTEGIEELKRKVDGFAVLFRHNHFQVIFNDKTNGKIWHLRSVKVAEAEWKEL